MKRNKLSIYIGVPLIALAAIGVVCFAIYELILAPWDIWAKGEYLVSPIRNVAKQELLFRRDRWVDQNNNGIGEFGWINELSGAKQGRCIRNSPFGAWPPYLVWVACYFPAQDVACWNHPFGSYVLYLPFPGRGAMDDRLLDCAYQKADVKSATASLDHTSHGDFIALQERHFVLYAVPVLLPDGYSYMYKHLLPQIKHLPPAPKPLSDRMSTVWRQCLIWLFGYGKPARYSYVINEKGEVHFTAMEHTKYLWPRKHVTDYRAAYVDDGTTGLVWDKPLADGQKGFDGNIWYKLKDQPELGSKSK